MAAADYYTQVYTMFVGYFGRPPAQSGLDYYANLVNAAGGKLNAVLDDFHKAAESQALFAGKSIEQQVNIIFQNLFGRDAAPAGLNYWAGEIAAGRLALSQAAYAIAQGAQTADKGVLTAKIDSAKLWVAGLNTTTEILTFSTEAGRAAGRDFLKTVTTSTPAAQTAVDAALKAMVDGGNTNPGQTFPLTAGIDNLTGTSGNDSFVGDDSGASPAISPADTINGGNGTDTASLYISGNRALIGNAVEVFSVQASATATFDMNNVSGATEIKSNNSAAALTFGNVKNAVTTVVAGGTGAAVNDVYVNFANNVITGTGKVRVEAANIDDLGLSNTDDSQQYSTLEIQATGSDNSTVATLTDDDGTALTLLRTLNVTGDKRLSITDVLTGVTTIDASTSTGGARVVIDTAGAVTFKGSAKNDRVDVGVSGLTNTDVLTGGDGTDTLRLADGDQMTTANAVNVKGFEILEVRHTADTAETYDVDNIITNNTLTGVTISGGEDTTTRLLSISNINDAALANIKIELTSDTNLDNVTLTAKNFVAGGTTDSATIEFNNNSGIGANDADGIDIGTLTFANLDKLTIKSTSDGTPAAGEQNSIGTLTATDLETIVVTGDQEMSINLGATSTGVTEVDASGLSRALTLDGAAGAGAGSVLVKGTARGDTITIDTALQIGTVYVGARASTETDAVVFDGGNGATTNSIQFTGTALNSGDVVAGTVTGAFTGGAIADTIRVNFTSEVEALLKVGGTSLKDASANVTITGNTLGNNTNVIATADGTLINLDIDLNGDGSFTAGTDLRITLTGVAGGGNETLVYDAANDFFLFTVV